MADVTQRMLALLSTLQTGRRFSGQELASRLEVSLRTVRRDVERLRSYGYPVETQPGPAGYYRLMAGSSLPPLVLDDDEAIAMLLGLVTLAAAGPGDGDGDGDDALDDAAARAYGKLDQFLPARLRARVVALRASLESGHQRGPGVRAALLSDVAQAVADRRIVRFTYLDRHGVASERRVEPHRQIHLHQRWYLLGWDLDRSDWRVFRADRITDLQVSGARHEARDLPAASALAYLRQGLNVDRQPVRLIVDAAPAEVADAFKGQDTRLEAITGQQTEATVWLDTWQWLVLDLAFLDADVSIVEPSDVRTAIAAFARRLLASSGEHPP
jgi:predicted DNA-binding transcriptional regulator YafY